MESPSAGEMWI